MRGDKPVGMPHTERPCKHTYLVVTVKHRLVEIIATVIIHQQYIVPGLGQCGENRCIHPPSGEKKYQPPAGTVIAACSRTISIISMLYKSLLHIKNYHAPLGHHTAERDLRLQIYAFIRVILQSAPININM
jgi:hypothetical protein